MGRVEVKCRRICWRLEVGTLDSSLDVRYVRGDDDYEMRQCDACHQLKENSRTKETIAHTISQCYGGCDLSCIHLDVEGGWLGSED
jgi:hypothetical protein